MEKLDYVWVPIGEPTGPKNFNSTARMKVEGGWIYRSMQNHPGYEGTMVQCMAMVFVPET